MLDPLAWTIRQITSLTATCDSPWPFVYGGLGVLAATRIAAAIAPFTRTAYRRLMRFYGYRKLFALLRAAGIAALGHLIAASYHPQPVGSIPSLLIWMFAWAYWWHVLVLPVRGYGFHGRRYSTILRLSGWSLLVLLTGSLVPAIWMASQSWMDDRGRTFLIRTALPLGLASLTLFYPDVKAWLNSNATLRRHVIAEGDCAGWMGPFGIRGFRDIWPTRTPQAGAFSTSSLFVGWTTFETSFRARDEIVLKEGHLATIAMPGSGKKLLIGNVLGTINCSTLCFSTKSDLADEYCGPRVDQRLFVEGASHHFPHLGVDPRGLTRAKRFLPRSRCFVNDPSGQSRFAKVLSAYNFVSDLELLNPLVTEFITAIAIASFPDQPGQRDRFWTLGPRGFFASAIAHILTSDPNPEHHNLPYIADFCMGIDPIHRRSDPAVFEKNLLSMMTNPALDGFVMRGATNIFEQIGSHAYSSLRSEFENNTRWMTTPWMREHLTQPSHYSYRELGQQGSPVSVFIVPPRGDAALQSALPWMRTHAELALQILQTTRRQRTDQVLVIADEMRQYGGSISAIRNGLTVLRDSNVRLWMFAQSWPSLELILGKDATAELEATSSLNFFGCNDLATAQKISGLLGRYVCRVHSDYGGRESIVDVVTPVEIMHELRQSSNLQYVFPASGGPMRLERAAYKALKTKEGAWFAALPALQGRFDEPF